METKRMVRAVLAGCLAVGLSGIATPMTALAAGANAGTAKTTASTITSDDESTFVKPTEAPNYSYTLKKVGSFSGDKKSLKFKEDAALRADGSDLFFLGPDGKSPFEGQAVRAIEYMGNGIYRVSLDKGDDPNCTGLVRDDGQVLLPCEAFMFIDRGIWMHSVENRRFIEVVYATEETDDASEAVVYNHDGSGSKVMYKAYAKVFDLQKGKFVKGIRITKDVQHAFNDLYDAFTIKENGTTTLYDAKGKAIWKTSDYCTPHHASIAVQAGGWTNLIDTKGEKRFGVEGNLTYLNGSRDYYLQEDDGKTIVIDIDGNQVLKGSYDSVKYETGGLFVVGEDSDRRVVNGLGETIVKTDSSSNAITEILPGCYYVDEGSNKHSALIWSGENILSSKDGVRYLCVKNDDDEYYVFDDADFSLELNRAGRVGTALASGFQEGEYHLFDLFTGKALLDQDCEIIQKAGNYLYTYLDGTWTTYELVLKN